MNPIIPVIVCALISLVFLTCLLKFGVKDGKLDWKYTWLVFGIVLPWFYFLTDSIHISLPGGSSLDLHFRDTIDGRLQRSGLLPPQLQPAKAHDPLTQAVVIPNTAYVSFRDALHSQIRTVADQKGVHVKGSDFDGDLTALKDHQVLTGKQCVLLRDLDTAVDHAIVQKNADPEAARWIRALQQRLLDRFENKFGNNQGSRNTLTLK